MKIISKEDFKIIKNHKDGSLDKKRVLNFLNIENIKQIINKVDYKDFVILFFDTKDNTTDNVKLLFKTINNFYLRNYCRKQKLRIKENKFNNTVLLDILKLYQCYSIGKVDYRYYFGDSFKIEEIQGNYRYVCLFYKFA